MVFEQVFVNTVIHLEAYSGEPSFIQELFNFYQMADVGLSLLFDLASFVQKQPCFRTSYVRCDLLMVGG